MSCASVQDALQSRQQRPIENQTRRLDSTTNFPREPKNLNRVTR